MTMNNRGALRYIIDIETAPIADAAEYVDLTQFAAPSNWKDPEKIKANIQEQQDAAIAKAALDLDLCRVVAVGMQSEEWNEPAVRVAHIEEREAEIIRDLWDEIDNRVTIGYNQIGFDLPILLRRSLYLGIHAPALNLDKYRSPHIDLQQRLSLNGTKPYRSLNWYCKRMKLDVPCDATSGKDMGQLVAEQKWDEVASHCRADVLKTRALAERMGILKPQVEMAL